MPRGRPTRRRAGPGRGLMRAEDILETSASPIAVPSNRVVARRGRRTALTTRSYNLQLEGYRVRNPLLVGHPALSDNAVDCHYAGQLDQLCVYCSAQHFAGEKVRDHFTQCCHNGKVNLEPVRQHPFINSQLQTKELRTKFQENIREYNSALALGSLTTSGAMLNQPGRGPFSLKVHGEAYRLTGPLQSLPNQRPVYAQLFYIDHARAHKERMARPENKGCDAIVMEQLHHVLADVNPYVQSIQMMKEVEAQEARLSGDVPVMSLYFVTERVHDQRRYNLPTTLHDIGAVFVSTDGAPPSTDSRDVVFHSKAIGMQRINIISPLADPFLYPLLFPYGEKGWTPGRDHVGPNRTSTRNKVTLLEYYGYRFAIREGFSSLHAAGKLFQQYMIDAYLKKEGNDLAFIRANQKQLRAECYKGLQDYVLNQAAQTDGVVGKVIVLPSSFIGSPRNMHQHYQDAMAVVRQEGKPDYFITFTCNPKWREITENLQEGEQPHLRPDLIVRVFNLKLKALMEQLTKKHVLGKVDSFVYVVEFQKRGLPHAHILLIMQDSSKPREVEEIDSAITAEIPDKENEPRLHELMRTHMIHGPCGAMNPQSPCMQNGSCSKSFPKDFSSTTKENVDGFPLYRRRDSGITCAVGAVSNLRQLDNRWVVPTNLYLLQMFECHINVEMCQTVKSVKYLYKYLHKGYDCADVEGQLTINHDEIKMYMDSRYIGSMESAFRLFGSKCMDQSHVVIRLPVHLPNEDIVYFREGEESEAINRRQAKKSKLEAFFELNSSDESARSIAYPEIPTQYTFQTTTSKWKKRVRGGDKVISRMYTVSPKDIERFSLRVLLLTLTGSTSYDDLKTFDSQVFDTFHAAALARGLLKDDSQWGATLADAASFNMPSQMRDLFAYIIINGSPTNPLSLWLQFKTHLCEDFGRLMTEDLSERKALFQIEEVLRLNNTTCPTLPRSGLSFGNNVEIDREDHAAIARDMFVQLNGKQKEIAQIIIRAVETKSSSNCFFLQGAGGTGKTFLYTYLIRHFKSQGLLPAISAFTGIAATLLHGGRTVHSVFKLPVPVLETSTSSIKPNSMQGKALKAAPMILIDEAPMMPGLTLTVIDRLMKDLMQSTAPFGGKIVLLGGDFRQTLPVVPHGARASIVGASIKRNALWQHFKLLTLETNMRTGAAEIQFAEYLTDIGNGTIENPLQQFPNAIDLPTGLTEPGCMIEYVYGKSLTPESVSANVHNTILAPKNEDCKVLNEAALSRLTGQEHVYISNDEIVTDDPREQQNFPTEFLNSLTPSGLPEHKLRLKVGTPVMVLRNLHPKKGIVNGTRCIVTQLSTRNIAVRVLTGESTGTEILLPAIDMAPSDPTMPFTIQRRQIPVKVCFAMTINKSQGQTFNRIGIVLPQPVFSHGQLYVAMSRVRSADCLRFKVGETNRQGRLAGNEHVFTDNVVFKEILN